MVDATDEVRRLQAEVERGLPAGDDLIDATDEARLPEAEGFARQGNPLIALDLEA